MPKYRVIRTWASKYDYRRGQVIEDPPLRNIGSLIRLCYIEEIGKPTPEDRPKKVVEAEARVKARKAKNKEDREMQKPGEVTNEAPLNEEDAPPEGAGKIEAEKKSAPKKAAKKTAKKTSPKGK